MTTQNSVTTIGKKRGCLEVGVSNLRGRIMADEEGIYTRYDDHMPGKRGVKEVTTSGRTSHSHAWSWGPVRLPGSPSLGGMGREVTPRQKAGVNTNPRPHGPRSVGCAIGAIELTAPQLEQLEPSVGAT